MNSAFRKHLCTLMCALLLVLSFSPPAFSQQSMRFKQLSIEQGLSQSSVEAIVQDRSGLIWIGTEDGLNRFDGYEFTVFRNDLDDPNSISDNNIWCLYVDREGYLWIGTYTSGLNRFDPGIETFTRYLHNPEDPHSISSNRIRSITEDLSGAIWIGTRDGGFNRLERGSGSFTRFAHDPDSGNSLLSDNVRSVCPCPDGTLWIATNRGFSRFDTGKEKFTHFSTGAADSNSLVHDNVRHIFMDRSGILWISTNGGLSSFDPQSLQFVNYVHEDGIAGSISSNNLRKVYEDSYGRLYIATSNGGLCLLDREKQYFTSYINDPADPQSLSNNGVRVIFEDRSGLLWLGTFGGGLNIHDPGTDRFRHYRHDPADPNSLSDRIIWSVAEGPGGDIWFGTNTGDLNRFIRNTGKYDVFTNVPERRRDGSSEYIRSILWDNAGRLWLTSCNTGVYRIDQSGKIGLRLVHDPETPNSLGDDDVRSISRDERGDIWFCLADRGLDHHNPATGTFTHFTCDPDNPRSIGHDYTLSIIQDRKGTYWLATKSGFDMIEFSRDPSGISISDITRLYHDPSDSTSLSNSYILSMHEARNGDIWIGTMQGLSKLRNEDRSNPVFTRYFMKNGLPNDVIYGILEDSGGNLWLSTNFGLSRLDPETETFKNFDTRDGLHGNEFNTGTFCRTSRGTFIFGGVNGATEFHPDSLSESTFNAPVVLTGFNIFDKPARLDRSISSTKEITLSHKDNYFSFEFASLDYSKPDRNRYKYMLEGLDRDWTNAGTRRFAGYTHVDAGKYVFKVRGTNGDGVWSDDVASVRIIITPPFWKTWWFIMLMALATTGGIAAVITYRVRQLLAIERLRSKIAADLHDDIGAGLTEISIMGEVISRKIPASSKELIVSEIERIGDTSRHLIDSMSDIVWLINPRRDSLFDLISRLGDSFKETLHAGDIHFKTQNLDSLKNVRLSMECRQNLYLVFKEAINNSLKYSECTEISLNVELSGKKLVMRLSDNGKGFDTDQAQDGNGLRNMNERADRLGGSLGIDTGPGQGTVIEFTGNIC